MSQTSVVLFILYLSLYTTVSSLSLCLVSFVSLFCVAFRLPSLPTSQDLLLHNTGSFAPSKNGTLVRRDPHLLQCCETVGNLQEHATQDL